jgi:hypothetical protein
VQAKSEERLLEAYLLVWMTLKTYGNIIAQVVYVPKEACVNGLERVMVGQLNWNGNKE